MLRKAWKLELLTTDDHRIQTLDLSVFSLGSSILSASKYSERSPPLHALTQAYSSSRTLHLGFHIVSVT